MPRVFGRPMKFFGMTPSSPNRFFNIQFKDIQIRLGPNIRPVFTGGFLRAIRRFAPAFSLFVVAVFCLHCSKPIANRWVGLGKTQTWGLAGAKRGFNQVGHASWYGGNGDGFAYKRTANGETMKPDGWTCAHPYLPFGTIVKVENLANNLSAILRVNDRGPYIGGRIIDVSLRAAEEIGIVKQGIAEVRVHIIQDLVRTNKITIAAKAEPSEASPSGPPLTLKNFDPTAIFVPLAELINNPIANMSRLPWKRLSAAIQGIEEIINRSRNRRSEPFINRKR